MILLVLRGKVKRLICRMFGHRIDDVGDDDYPADDFCDRCGHWL